MTKKTKINRLIASGVTDPTAIVKKTKASLFYVKRILQGIKSHRYTYLIVDRSRVMSKALAKIRAAYGNQKKSVEKAILDLAKTA